MSIQPTFTCVACEYRRLPFDPQESAGTCPSCGREYFDQPERLSKHDLRIKLFHADRAPARHAEKQAAEQTKRTPIGDHKLASISEKAKPGIVETFFRSYIAWQK